MNSTNILIFIAFISLSCGEANTAKKKLTYQGKHKIFIGDKVAPVTDAMQLVKINDLECLVYLNSFSNSLEIFELENGVHKETLKYDFDGPEGVGEIRGFYYLSEDSILLTSKSFRLISLVNSESHVVDKLSYQKNDEITGPFYSRSDYNNMIQVGDGKLFFTQYPRSPWNALSIESFENSHIEFFYDLKTGNVGRLAFGYPRELREKYDYPPYFCRVKVKQDFYYAFLYSNQIFHAEEGVLKPYKITAEVPPVLPYTKPSDPLESMQFSIASPSIRNFLYDEYNEVFYVIYYLGQDFDASKKISQVAENKYEAVVIVLDSDLTFLTSVDISTYTLNLQNVFVAKNGLYISDNNELNPTFDENYLTFSRFELK